MSDKPPAPAEVSNAASVENPRSDGREPPKKYDVAFSFLQQDEGLATQLNDLLQDRFSTFLYSKEQEKLAGTDGQENFTNVFGSESRTVAVLYRPGWGQSRWTRIEETAIRGRGYDEGFDFATFIVVAGNSVPAWLPKTRLWFALERFGLRGAAAVVEQRIQEAGGNSREEGVLDRAARLKRAEKLAEAQFAFARSEKSVKSATEAHAELITLIKQRAKEVQNAGGSCNVFDWAHGTTGVGCGRIRLALAWRNLFLNDLSDAFLSAEYFDGTPDVPGLMVIEKATELAKHKIYYQLVAIDRQAWVYDGREYSTDRLCDFLLKTLMDHWEKRRGIRR